MKVRTGRAIGVAAALAFGGLVAATAGLPSRAADTPPDLGQQWNAGDRDYFYTTSQGSELLPYDWFLSLEQAESPALFRQRLSGLGFLPGPARHNPDNLPLGFVRNDDSQDREGIHVRSWVGFTCAACHTGAIRYRATPAAPPSLLIIDGAPSNADFGDFVKELTASVAATSADEVKFDRFAHHVLGRHYSRGRQQQLQKDFHTFAGRFAVFAESSRPTHDWLPGRLDAFGMIFNRVCNLNLGLPENNRPPDAPVSFPFLWNTFRQDHIQWFGEVPNKNEFDTFVRNMGEVLGVFAKVDVNSNRFLYNSCIRRLDLYKLERKVEKLGSPKWPAESLGRVNLASAARGQGLYQRYCVSCHSVLTPDSPVAHIQPYPLSLIGTDPDTTVNLHQRLARTGPLEGRKISVLFGNTLGATAPAGDMVRNTVLGALLDPPISLGERPRFPKIGTMTEPQMETEYVPVAPVDRDKIGYEARPLNGIWATAPYLHNGSVASLYELLLPPEERLKTFTVGTYEYDPVHVGYRTEATFGGKLFDTDLPGNHNTGHNYGTDLTPDQRMDLIAYLKTL